MASGNRAGIRERKEKDMSSFIAWWALRPQDQDGGAPFVVRLHACVVVALLATGLLVQAAEKAPQAVLDLIDSELVPLQSDPVIVAAVKQANSTQRSLEQIKEIDDTWRSTPGIDEFMRSLLDSECGRHLSEIMSSRAYYSEIFVMDHDGANVAMTDKTSDFWQGDEAKFIESYRDGAGGMHVGDVEFDESAQAYLVQVSLPIKDGERVIGAITVGIDVDQLELEQ
jgi:hypothetical protein